MVAGGPAHGELICQHPLDKGQQWFYEIFNVDNEGERTKIAEERVTILKRSEESLSIETQVVYTQYPNAEPLVSVHHVFYDDEGNVTKRDVGLPSGPIEFFEPRCQDYRVGSRVATGNPLAMFSGGGLYSLVSFENYTTFLGSKRVKVPAGSFLANEFLDEIIMITKEDATGDLYVYKDYTREFRNPVVGVVWSEYAVELDEKAIRVGMKDSQSVRILSRYVGPRDAE